MGETSLIMNFMLSDDGNTLLSVRQASDGSLELMTTPVTILKDSCKERIQFSKAHNYETRSNEVNVNNNLFKSTHNNEYQDKQFVENSIEKLSVVDDDVPTDLEDLFDDSTEELSCCATIRMQETIESAKKEEGGLLLGKGNSTKSISKHGKKLSVAGKKNSRKGHGKTKKSKAIKEKKTFKCDICGEEMKKQSVLRKHLQDHAENKNYRCPKCSESFNIPTNFNLHMATHCTKNPKCPECGRKFVRLVSLKAHIKVHEVDENLYCRECEQVFENESQLEEHLKLHQEKWQNDEYRRCKLCPKQFNRPALYRQHLRGHYKSQTNYISVTKKGQRIRTSYRCKICMKAFSKPSFLDRHIRIHTREKPFKCDICDKGFSQESSMKLHALMHKGIKPHACHVCQAKFTTKSNLQSHAKCAHKQSDDATRPIYRCTLCSCVFQNLGVFGNHLSRAHGIKINETTSIDSHAQNSNSIGKNDEESIAKETEDFLNSQIIPGDDDDDDEHLKDEDNSTIDGFVPVDGEEGKAKVVVREMQNDNDKWTYKEINHRIVNKKRFYQCLYCPKTARKPSDIVRHLKTHTREKPFKCDICKRCFSLKTSLVVHLKQHKKKYSCSKCNKSFETNEMLAQHPCSHIYQCLLCNLTFIDFDTLRTHSAKHNTPQEIEKRKREKQQQHQNVQDPTLSKMEHRARQQNNQQWSEEVERLAPKVKLKEPLVVRELNNGDVTIEPRIRFENGRGDGRPHKCPSCSAAFMKLSHLQQHYRKHTGERPFSCDICDKKFSSKSTVTAHQRVHDPTKKFKCSLCNSSFSCFSSLKRHHVAHTTKRPYMCPYCNKTFKTGVNCTKHMKMHKKEIAQKQLEIQKKIKEAESLETQKKLQEVETEFLNIFQPEIFAAPIYVGEPEATLQDSDNSIAINFSDQIQYFISEEDDSAYKINSTFTDDPTLNNDVTLHSGAILNDPSTMSALPEPAQNILCDSTLPQLSSTEESNILNISSFTGEHVLTPENINEIEEVLSQQILNFGLSLSRPNDGDSSTAFQQNDGPTFSIIYDNGKILESQIDPNLFSAHLDAFDISQLGLETIDLGIDQSSLTNDLDITSSTSTLESEQTNSSLMHAVPDINDFLNTSNNVANNQMLCASPKDVFKQNSTRISENLVDSEQTLQCHICKKSQLKAEDLREHLKLHKQQNICSYCNLDCNSSSGLSSHLRIHKIQETFKCYECNKEFSTSLQLRDHIKEHVKEEFKLKNAGAEENVLFDIELGSKKKKSQSRRNKCDYCSKIFSKPSDLSRHVRIHTGERPYTCNICEKSFTVKCTLDAHMKIHSEKLFQCHICSVKFSTKKSLKIHMRLHTGDRPYQCSLCMLRFCTQGNLNVHMRKHSREVPGSITNELLEAPLRNKINKDNQKLLDEIIAAVEIDSSNLPECNQLVPNLQVSTEDNLIFMQIDDIESDLVASPKQVSVISSSTSEYEKQNNSDENQSKKGQKSNGSRYECETCGKSFTKPCQLKRHTRVHTGERPYTCETCDRKFAQKSTLQIHSKLHSGDRPYKCPHCSRSFLQSGNLRTHLRRIHKLELAKTVAKQKLKGPQQFVEYETKIVLQAAEEAGITFDDISLADFLD